VAIDSDLLRKRVESLEGLPTLPSVASSLLKMTQSLSTSATEVGELISKDQALTTRVLKLVNSAYYGFPKQITTVNHAVVILGFSRVKNIVLAASVFSLKGEEQLERFDLPAFWRHSLGTAVCARALARELHRGENEELFVCGLLHDLGKLVLSQVSPKDYDSCLKLAADRGCLINMAELEVLGLDHAEVGSWLAERWKLPPAVQTAIRRHHSPGDTRKDRDAAIITHMADIMARALQLGSGGDPTIPTFHPSIVAEVGLSPEMLDQLLPKMLDDLCRSADFFEMIEG
jgi:putative nucleotidyltransferase with HDIG domain